MGSTIGTSLINISSYFLTNQILTTIKTQFEHHQEARHEENKRELQLENRMQDEQKKKLKKK